MEVHSRKGPSRRWETGPERVRTCSVEWLESSQVNAE